MRTASLLLTLLALPLLAEQAKLPVIADTSLQASGGEINLNSGASPNIRIKGIEHFMLMKFDLRPIENWRIESATLRIRNVRKNLFRTVGLSTITADWQEGTGRSSQVDGGCTFTRAVWPDTLWAGPGSTFLDVALTYGNSLVRYTNVQDEADGWMAIDVDPALVYAMLSGASYGLCLSDEKGQTRANNDVCSREQRGSEPYMVVEGSKLADPGSVPALDAISAEPWPQAATFDSGAIRIKLRSPACFRYEVSCGVPWHRPAPLAPYLVPRPAPVGQEQTIVVKGLTPDATYHVRVAAVDQYGRRGAAQAVDARTSPAKPLPQALAAPDVLPPAGAPREGAGLRAWACPAECKVSPISGNVLEEVGATGYERNPSGAFRNRNPVWDANGAHLSGARGAVVALQVVVENPSEQPRELAFRFLSSAADPMPDPVGVFRNWYVKDGAWFPEYMVPLVEERAAIPAPDNKVPGQRNQSFTLIWEVPRNAAGLMRGGVRVTSGGNDLDVPISLQVLPFEIAAQTSFEVDLNCYGPVVNEPDWDKYLARERKYFAAAHALRATLNPLGYSHSGRTYHGWVPEVSGEGKDMKVSDWSVWDQHWGPYLDGSAFRGVRAGVPVTHMYLPFHENWPTPIAGHYTGGNDIRKYPDNIIAHALTAPVVEKAFDQTFQEAFVAITRQFAEHYRQRGWLKTDLQCYQNNKYYYKDEKSNFRGVSWWLLDEPMHRDDWMALRLFATLFKQGAAGAPFMKYRGDISRPQWQRDWLDGLVDCMAVSSAFFSYPRHCRRMMEGWGATFWHYGTANNVGASNLNGVAWPLKVYCAGGDGLLPWQVIGGDGALDTPTATALLVPGTRFGLDGPVASLRLLALCRGQQDVEYLNLLAKKRGYDRDQMARLVSDSLKLSATQQEAFVDEAGKVVFDRLSAEDFARLRAAVAGALL